MKNCAHVDYKLEMLGKILYLTTIDSHLQNLTLKGLIRAFIYTQVAKEKPP